MNKKPIIGILANTKFKYDGTLCDGQYYYGNPYVRKIVEVGGIPYFIPYIDEKVIPDSLVLCDGLILPGGHACKPAAFEVIDYFFNAKKPILGTCLGMQEIGMYSVNIENPGKRIMKDLDGHCKYGFTDQNPDVATMRYHDINIEDGSRLKSILKVDRVSVNSFHVHTISEVGSSFKVTARADDGVIEALEYKGDDRFVLGVQFHPEYLEDMLPIFETFIKECK